MSSGTFAPAPGAAPYARMVAAQARIETVLLLRNGEQLLLTLVIPIVLLLMLGATDVIAIDAAPGTQLSVAVAGVLTVAVMSAAFTGLAIATGFERRYGVLRRLAVTPLPRSALLLGKSLSVLVVELLQLVLVVVVALLLGWQPEVSWPAVGLLVLLGTTAFAGVGMLMAGTLRAEATLAAANLAFIVLLVGGAAVVPLTQYPDAIQPWLALLPSAALGEGMRALLVNGAGLPWDSVAVLAVWSIVGTSAAARFFRWE